MNHLRNMAAIEKKKSKVALQPCLISEVQPLTSCADLLEMVLDEPLAKHGEIGNGRDESRVSVTNSTLALGGSSYIMRRLAREAISCKMIFCMAIQALSNAIAYY